MTSPIFKHPLRVFYSEDYTMGEGLETVTKSKLLAKMITEGRVPRVELIAPKLATEEELMLIHSADYVRRVLNGETQLGECTRGQVGKVTRGQGEMSGRDAVAPLPINKLVRSVLATTGGMRDATNEALRNGRSGSFSSGLHHARADAGMGFCTFNGLALAALEALKKVKLVGILDLDAHCGGGTANILKKNKKVRLADVSVCSYDSWTPTAKSRHFIQVVDKPKSYLASVGKALKSLEGVEFLIYNAGMDTHERAGGLAGITLEIIQEREMRVVEWAREQNVPIVFALAGGYTWSGLTLKEVAELHLETVRAFNI
jgi:acetoin utilization deacetylase AcuC-like enzyme